MTCSVAINLKEIQELLSTIGQSNVTEFELKTDDFELRVSKASMIAAPPVMTLADAVVTVAPAPVIPQPPALTIPAPTSTPSVDDKWIAVTSPMVGTFYRASAPGEDPFVSVGDRVSNGQTVCILEAMKLMNEIESEVSGEVVKIIVEDGEPIEFGQTLMWVNPV